MDELLDLPDSIEENERPLDLTQFEDTEIDFDVEDDLQPEFLEELDAIPETYQDPSDTVDLKNSVSEAFKKNSSDVSRTLGLTESSGLPREIVESNLDEIEQLEKLKKIDFEDLQKNYPAISKMFADADSAAVFKDHIDNLKSLEDQIKGKSAPSFNTGRKLVERTADLAGGLIGAADKTSNFIEESLGDYGLGSITYRKPQSFLENFTFQNFGYRSSAEANALKEKGKLPNRLTQEASKGLNEFSLGYVPDQTWESTKKAFSEGGVFSGSAWSEVMGYAFENGVGSLPDMAAAVLALPAYVASRTDEIGETRAKNDGRTEAEMGDLLKAAPFAIGSTLFERFGAKAVAGAGKAVGIKAGAETAEQLGTEALKFSMSRVGKEGLKAGGVEAFTEFVQEGILEYVGEKWGTKAKMDWKEAADRGIGGAVAGGITGGQIGTVVAGYNENANAKKRVERFEAETVDRQIRDQSEQDRLDKITELMQPLREVNPELAQSKLEEIQEEHGLQDERVYIEPMTLQKAIEEGEYDLSSYEIDTVNELANDAIQNGTDVELTLGQYFDFAEDLQVRENVRLSEDGMSLNEIKDAPATQKAISEQMIAEAEKNVAEKTEADAIWKEVAKQIKATGTANNRTAKIQASLIPAWVTVKSVRSQDPKNKMKPMTVREVYDSMGVKIETAEQSSGAGVSLEQAQEQGYEGDNKGEAQEWVSALNKFGAEGMTKEARMTRAEEQGYDTSTVYYHGTKQDIKAFDTERDMNDLDYSAGAVFLTKSPELANTYAGIGGAVYPVYLKKGKTLEIDGKGNHFTNVDGEAQSTDDIAADYKDNSDVDSVDIKNIDDVGGETLNQFKENADPDNLYEAGSYSESKEKAEILRDQAKGKDVSIVFDPSNIRSVNAAFDPDAKDSANLLAQSEIPTNTVAFKKWFGDSKAVDANGNPKTVYHGSSDVRGILENGFESSMLRGDVHFFSDKESVSNTYAYDDAGGADYQNAEPQVIPVYLSMQNPLEVDAKGKKWRDTEKYIQEAKDKGHDGIIIKNSRDEYNNTGNGGELSTVYATFAPTQAKSAMTSNLRSRIDGIDIGGGANNGNFDPTNPNLLYQSETGKSGGVSDKNLYVAHNLTEENLIHVDELGGLAAPSLAVARIDKGEFDNFGEITLIANPEMAVSNKAKAFNADIYSPRHPSSVNFIDDIASERYEDQIGERVPDKFEDNGASALENDFNFQLAYLEDIGKAPKIKAKKVEPIVKKWGNPKAKHSVDYLYDNQKFINDVAKLAEEKNEKYKEIFNGEVPEKYANQFSDENGVPDKDFVRGYANEVMAYRKSGGKDKRQFAIDVDNKVRTKSIQKGFKVHAKKWEKDLIDEIKIFKGYTNSGNRRYSDYTLDNVVKEMTKTLQNGEGFSYGIPNIRAKNAKKFPSVKAMQKDRDSIVSKEEFESSKEEVESMYDSVLETIKWDYKGDKDSHRFRDDVGSALSDYDFREFDLSPESKKKVNDFIDHVRNMPTEYFESKVQRAVDIGEFHTAVVPNGTSKQAIDILKKKGLKVKKYKDAEGKKKAIEQTGQLFQENRASIELLPDNKRIIRLSKATKFFDGSDESSFLHEAGHLFLEMEKQYAGLIGVSEDQQAILDYLGLGSFDQLDPNTDKGRDAHEKFAESFENYLQEGKAPSPALYDAFRSFKQWLMQVYKNLTAYPEVQLNKEIRDVFDRMLATDEEIAAAKAVYGMDVETESVSSAKESLFKQILDQLTRTKTKEWKEEYDNDFQTALADLEESQVYQAEAYLRENKVNAQQAGEALGYLEPKTEKALDPKKDSIVVAIGKLGGINRGEAELQGIDPENWKGRRNVNNSYMYTGMPFKKNDGDSFDGMAENLGQYGYLDAEGIPLNANSLLDLVSDELGGKDHYSNQYEPSFDDGIELTSKPRRLYGKTDPKGISINQAAEENGYISGDAMLHAIADSKDIQIEATEVAKQSMLDKHGDILNDGTLPELARDAIQNEEKGKQLLKELKVMASKDRSAPKINKAMLKKAATEAIDLMPIKKLRGSVEAYHRKEVKAAQEVTRLESEGDTEGAIQAKMEQLLNFYLFREARDKVKDTESWRKYSQGVKTRKYSAFQVDPEYIANMKLFSSIFDFKKTPSKKSLEDLQSIANWIKSQNVEGETPIVRFYHPMLQQITDPEFEADDLVIKNWDDMTVNELRGVKEQLEHLRYIGGRMSSDSKFIQKQKAERLAEALENNFKGKEKKQYLHGGKKSFLDNIPTSWGLLSSITHVREFDGWRKDEANGAFHQEIYQKLSDIDQASMSLESELDEKIAELIRPYYENLNNGKGTEKTFKDEIGSEFVLSNSQRIMFGVYYGSPETRATLLQTGVEGNQLSEANTQVILDSLTDSDVKIIKGIWSINESLKSRMFAKEKEIAGIAPRAVEAMPFTVRGQTLEGGYQQIKYVSSAKDGLKRGDPMQNAMASTGAAGIKRTSAGSMNERIGAGGRIIKLDFHNFISSIKESSQFIAGATESRDIHSLLNNPTVKESFYRKYGEDRYRSFVDGVNGAIVGDALELQGYNKWVDIFATARSKMSVAMLMYSARNIAQQPVAITNLLARVNKVSYVKASAEVAGNPNHYINYVNEKSQFMKFRMKYVTREASDLVGSLDQSVAGGKLATMKRYGFTVQTAIDKAIGIPAWMVAYREGLVLYPNNESKAISHADQIVKDSLGSGRAIDMAPMLSGAGEGGNPMAIEAKKQLTFMGSFFAKVGEGYYQTLKKNDIKTLKGAAKIGHDLSWTLVIPAIVSALVVADIPDEEDPKSWVAKQIGKYGLASIMGVRDLAGFMIDGFEPKTAYASTLASIGKTVQSVTGAAIGEDDVDSRFISKLIRNTAPFHGLPMSYQVARSIDGFSDENQGIAGALLEGKNRNK